jgi:hypothetical protein
MVKGMLWSVSLLSVLMLPSSRPPSKEPTAATRDGRLSRTLQTFDAMYGVDGPFVGEAFPIRGIPGDELPWRVKDARGRLDTDGHLTIRVRGLVFTDDPEVPPDLRGTNDEAEFRGAVSCLTEEGDQVTTVNVISRGFPASASGDSSIRDTVTLPNPCVAPIIMVLAGSEDKWFAVTGFESEEEE